MNKKDITFVIFVIIAIALLLISFFVNFWIIDLDGFDNVGYKLFAEDLSENEIYFGTNWQKVAVFTVKFSVLLLIILASLYLIFFILECLRISPKNMVKLRKFIAFVLILSTILLVASTIVIIINHSDGEKTLLGTIIISRNIKMLPTLGAWLSMSGGIILSTMSFIEAIKPKL